jgi:hypothetical protein
MAPNIAPPSSRAVHFNTDLHKNIGISGRERNPWEETYAFINSRPAVYAGAKTDAERSAIRSSLEQLSALTLTEDEHGMVQRTIAQLK